MINIINFVLPFRAYPGHPFPFDLWLFPQLFTDVERYKGQVYTLLSGRRVPGFMTLPGRRVKGERSKVKEVNSQYRET